MKYRVHYLKVDKKTIQEKTEQFINSLDGEVVSIIPGVEPIFLPIGATSRVKYLLIVEKRA